jgi:hypothetical protein
LENKCSVAAVVIEGAIVDIDKDLAVNKSVDHKTLGL